MNGVGNVASILMTMMFGYDTLRNLMGNAKEGNNPLDQQNEDLKAAATLRDSQRVARPRGTPMTAELEAQLEQLQALLGAPGRTKAYGAMEGLGFDKNRSGIADMMASMLSRRTTKEVTPASLIGAASSPPLHKQVGMMAGGGMAGMSQPGGMQMPMPGMPGMGGGMPGGGMGMPPGMIPPQGGMF